MDFIVYAADFGHKKGEFSRRTARPQYFLSYFRTDYIYEINGELVRGNEGDFMIIAPGEIVYHGPTPEAVEGFRNDWMYLTGSDFGELLSKYPLPLGVPFAVKRSVYLSRTIDRIHKEKSFMLIGYKEKCDMIMTEMIIDLYRDYVNTGGGGLVDKIDFVRGEIMRDFARPHTLSDMARLSGYSESRFSALYKETYGVSPISDLINKRIEEAELLIRYGNLSLAEIAERVGFNSLYYFSKYFKKKLGKSPSEYKKTIEKKENFEKFNDC